MEIDHSDQTAQPDGYNILGHDLERSQGIRLRSNSVRSEEKNAAVRAEIERVNRLPSNSSYALHRLQVLNKILNLISVQIWASSKYIGNSLQLSLHAAAGCRSLLAATDHHYTLPPTTAAIASYFPLLFPTTIVAVEPCHCQPPLIVTASHSRPWLLSSTTVSGGRRPPPLPMMHYLVLPEYGDILGTSKQRRLNSTPVGE
ncbi:hypothetical protein M5K25_014555 [Dendrobium thyrsiflorum]|uniref:Uncharacterized protein n=1 Tax=Dendrobium thyrsiflorum TaxID=117978 RepID=A0ABD0UVV4_DENTH